MGLSAPSFLGASCPWEAHGHLLFSAMISGGSPDMRGSLGFHSLEPDRCVWSPEPSSRSSVSKKKKRTVDLISLTCLCLSAGLEPGQEIVVTLHTSNGRCLCYSHMSWEPRCVQLWWRWWIRHISSPSPVPSGPGQINPSCGVCCVSLCTGFTSLSPYIKYSH